MKLTDLVLMSGPTEPMGGGSAGSPDVVPGLEDRQQRHMVREAAAGEVPVDKAEALPVVDERLRETGSGRDGAHGVSDTGGRQRAVREPERLQKKSGAGDTDWKMQPMIIIFPSRGSMGSRARIRPNGVSSSLESRASRSGEEPVRPVEPVEHV